MSETLVIDGLEFVYRHRRGIWVAVWGPEYIYQIRQVGKRWFCRKPYALEDLHASESLEGCALLAARHYKRVELARLENLQRRTGLVDDYEQKRQRLLGNDRVEGREGDRQIKAARPGRP